MLIWDAVSASNRQTHKECVGSGGMVQVVQKVVSCKEGCVYRTS